jgi:hypothetical protein
MSSRHTKDPGSSVELKENDAVGLLDGSGGTAVMAVLGCGVVEMPRSSINNGSAAGGS